MIVIVAIAMLTILMLTGFILTRRRQWNELEKYEFAHLYRDKFIELANKYNEDEPSYFATKSQNVDHELYVWLTKNVVKMQREIGFHGIVYYTAPFQAYKVPSYQIFINTLPKFKIGSIEDYDMTLVDDSLLRYIGEIETNLETSTKEAVNPVIWFREGFKAFLNLPLYLLKWFGIISGGAITKVTTNNIYKILVGIGGLVAFISGVVTILQGYDQSFTFIKKLLGK